MKEIVQSTYSKYFFTGLFFIILCAWFSNGFYHIDEHLHVLEFASWKMGLTPSYSLPWEFFHKMRASLLPDIVYLLSKVLTSIGLYNPFTVVFLLHLFTGIAAWFVTCRLCLFLLKNMKTEKGKKLFILMALFLWFVPYLSVRFTGENISGILFLYGAYLILRAYEKNTNLPSAYLIAGVLFGFSFFVRITIVIAMIGFVTWLLVVKKSGWKNIFILALPALIVIVLNSFLDFWFYGEPVSTLVNFLSIYVHHSAPEMGANHPWFFISQSIIQLIPPISLFLLFFFAVGVHKNLRDPFVWAIVPFIIIHSIIRHKELRFMFPVTFIFIYACALGLDYLLTNKTYLKFHKYIYAISLLIIIPLFAYCTFTPAKMAVNYCRFLYNNVPEKNTTLFVLPFHNDYLWLMTNKSFYKNPNIKPVVLTNPNQIGESLQTNHLDTAYYFDESGVIIKDTIQGYKTIKVYSYYPVWVSDFITRHFQRNYQFWNIYRVTKTE